MIPGTHVKAGHGGTHFYSHAVELEAEIQIPWYAGQLVQPYS